MWLPLSYLNSTPHPGSQGLACQMLSLTALGGAGFQSPPCNWASLTQSTRPPCMAQHSVLIVLSWAGARASPATQSHLALNQEMVSGSRWQCPVIDVWHSSFSMWEFDCVCGGMSLNQTCCVDEMPEKGTCLGFGSSEPPNICLSVWFYPSCFFLKSCHLFSTHCVQGISFSK